jgi:hypothetical protein
MEYTVLYCIVLGVFTDPLPSNRRHIVAGAGSRGNVSTESLPSNWSMRDSFAETILEIITTASPYSISWDKTNKQAKDQARTDFVKLCISC